MRLVRYLFLLLSILVSSCDAQTIIVNSGGAPVVDASGLPLTPGQIINENGSGQRLIISIGDSNSRGNSTAVGSTPSNTVYQWDDGAGNLRQITNLDCLEPVAASAIGSQWPSFLDEYADLFPGKTPVICITGVGGTRWHSGTTAWSWDTSPDLWPNARDKANRALQYLGLNQPWAVYINCGINDAAQDAYTLAQSYLNTMIDRVNTEWSSPRIFLVLSGKANETNYSNSDRIYTMRQLQKQVMQTYSNVEICTSMQDLVAMGGYVQVDDYHLNFDGNELHGKMVARQMAMSTTLHKYTRSVAGLFFDPISTTRQGWIDTFVNTMDGASLLYEMDELHLYSDCAADDKNMIPDWAFLSPAIPVNSPTRSYNGLTTNGTTQYVSKGVRSQFFHQATEQDFISGVFIGTNSSAAGGSDRALFGIRESGSGGITLLNQRSTSQLGILATSTSGSLSSSETKFANDSHYFVGRLSGDMFLGKNGAIVGSPVTVTYVAHGATLLRGSILGAYNANTSVSQYINCQFYADYTAQYTTWNLTTFNTAMNTLIANWMTNVN